MQRLTAFKYRLRPTQTQREYFSRCFGCVRLVYNACVERGIAREEPLLVSALKADKPFLKDVDSLALANAVQHYRAAKREWLKSLSGKRKGRKVKAPTFHKKGQARDSYTTNNQHGTVAVKDGMVKLPKVGWVTMVQHRPLEGAVRSATVSREKDGTFYVSILCLVNAEIPTPRAEEKPVEEQRIVGLDMSLTHFYVSSDEELDATRTKYVRRFREAEKRVKRLNRQHSRKQLVPTGEVRFSRKWQKDIPIKEPSHNREKARLRLAKAHRRVANRRLDFICQEASRLSKTYDVIVVEEIDMQAMARSLRLGKSVNDLGWGAFINRLAWACEKNGCTLVKADRWFASSKTCSVCGHKNDELTLSDREWTCPHCGAHHDRDRNAALNLRAWYYTNILALAALPLERREVTPLESSPLPLGPSALGQAFTSKEETSPQRESSEGSPLLGEAKWG